MPTLRLETVNERRENLLAGATRCFARQGFARTSMRDIAKEAGVTTGAIYAHFSAKDALLAAMAQEFAKEREDHFHRPPPGLTAAEAVGACLTDLTDHLDKDERQDLLKSDVILMAESLDNELLKKTMIATDRQHFGAFERLLRRNKRWKPGIDVRVLSRVLTGAVFGLIILKLFHPDTDRKKYIRCLEALIQGAIDTAETSGISTASKPEME